MLLKGKKIEGLNIVDVFIPRGNNDEDALHFRCQAVADYTVHDGLNKQPKAKKGRNRQGHIVEMTDDKSYQASLEEYAQRRVAYMTIKSLEATPDLVWETVDINNPDTWMNWKQEFIDAGFTVHETHRIFNGICEACGLSEDKVEAARNRFLAGALVESEEQSSPREDQSNTRSGELASDSE